MTEERRMFVHRVLWAILPGVFSGLIVGGIAYGAIVTKLDYIDRSLQEVKAENNQQDRYMQRTRELVYKRFPQ